MTTILHCSRTALKSRIGCMLWAIIRTVILLGLCYIILYPFIVKILNGLKDSSDFLDPTVRFIPKHFTLFTVQRTIEKIGYWKALGNTFVLSLGVGILQTAVALFGGYGFARFKFRGNALIFGMVILMLVIPPQTILVPLYLKFRNFLGFINLIDTPYPLLIMSATAMGYKNGLFIFLFRQFFRNIPHELDEAAAIDGCGPFKTFFHIMLPTAGTMITTVFLLSFSWQWTDTYYNGLFFKGFSVLPTVINLAQMGETQIMGANMVNVAAILAILPLAVLYIFAQKFFVESIENSGLVG